MISLGMTSEKDLLFNDFWKLISKGLTKVNVNVLKFALMIILKINIQLLKDKANLIAFNGQEILNNLQIEKKILYSKFYSFRFNKLKGNASILANQNNILNQNFSHRLSVPKTTQQNKYIDFDDHYAMLMRKESEYEMYSLLGQN